MKTLRIVLALAVGLAYIWFAMNNPGYVWLVRLIAVAAIFAIWWFTRLIGGPAAADADPLAADPIPSLSLSERSLESSRDKTDDAGATKASP